MENRSYLFELKKKIFFIDKMFPFVSYAQAWWLLTAFAIATSSSSAFWPPSFFRLMGFRAGFQEKSCNFPNSVYNNTLGHSDPAWAIGLESSSRDDQVNDGKLADEDDSSDEANELFDDDSDLAPHIVGASELNTALVNAIQFIDESDESLVDKGWQVDISCPH